MPDDAGYIINPDDQYAVQAAVDLARTEAGSTVTVLSMGPSGTEGVLKECLAVGADHAILVSDEAFRGADTLITAAILAAAIQKIGCPDLLICGRKSLDGDTGQLGPQLAEAMGWPWLRGAVSLAISAKEAAGRSVAAVCELGSERRHITAVLPAVVSVMRSPVSLRRPSISGLLRAKREPVTRLTAADLGVPQDFCAQAAAATRVRRVFSATVRRAGAVMAVGDKPVAAVHWLLEQLADRINGVREDAGLAVAPVLNGADDDRLRTVSAMATAPAAKYFGIWVYIEVAMGKATDVSYELLGRARKLAEQSGQPLGAVLIGEAAGQLAATCIALGADEVYIGLTPTTEVLDPMAHCDIFCRLVQEFSPATVMVGTGAAAAAWIPQAAGRLQTGLAAGCTDAYVDEETAEMIWLRPAGSMMAEVVCPECRPQMAIMQPHSDTQWQPDLNRSGKVFQRCYQQVSSEKNIMYGEPTPVLNAGMLLPNQAEIVLAGGRGLGGTAAFGELADLAAAFGAAPAASRAVVDEGWMPVCCQIGQSGQSIRPKIYVACGISGAWQHVAGIRGAAIVIAINTDPQAPIFQAADYGLVGDARQILPILVSEWTKYGINLDNFSRKQPV